MAPLPLRRYRAADHDGVWALHNAALNAVDAHGGNGPWDDDLHRIEEVYLAPGGEFLVGEAGGEIVAMGAVKPIKPGRAELCRMRVRPDCWRRGYGRQMLAALEAAARQAGVRELTLGTTTGQAAARGLYEAAGYREVGRRRHGPFEVVVYEKRLATSDDAAL